MERPGSLSPGRSLYALPLRIFDMMFETDKRERARCIREAALGFDDVTARTMDELADELEAEARAEEGGPPSPPQPA